MASASYPGNQGLPQEVRERVITTFRQTLDLYKDERRAEAAAGCEFILTMDSQFEPARKLLAKLRNPALPLDVDALLPEAARDDEALLRAARQAMAARDFRTATDLCTRVLGADFTNAEAQEILSAAQEKLEAEPFLQQFLQRCSDALRDHNLPLARNSLDKARALDPEHPALSEFAARVAAAEAPPTFDFSADTPSFVVDASRPAAPESPRAQSSSREAPAADFGFTFEEEPGGGFSFDPAPPPPPAAPPAATGGFEAQTFDFSSASIEVGEDDQQKIRQYLAEGDGAYDRGEYQRAIDIWSRIFLVDVTNDEASERIERAKRKRREIEQKTEQLMMSAQEARDRRDIASARNHLEDVLRIDPTHRAALDQLNDLDEYDGGAEIGGSSFAPPPMSYEDEDETYESSPAAPEPAPMGGKAAKAPPAAPVTARKSGTRVSPALIIVLIVIALGAAGWFAWSFFAGSSATQDSAETQTAFLRAQRLAREGKFDEAIGLLTAIPATDPLHDRALVMIDDLKRRKAEASERVDGRPAAEVYEEQLAAARAAYEAGDYLAAKVAFEKAAEIRALPPEARETYAAVAQQVAKLDAAMVLFKEGNYGEAITTLETLRAQDPENRNIRQLIVNAHFNLGAQALRANNEEAALQHFDNALAIDPEDELAKRSRELILRYRDKPKDLLFRIYVNHLPLR